MRALDRAALYLAAFLVFGMALLFGLAISPLWAWRQATAARQDCRRDITTRRRPSVIGRDVFLRRRGAP